MISRLWAGTRYWIILFRRVVAFSFSFLFSDLARSLRYVASCLADSACLCMSTKRPSPLEELLLLSFITVITRTLQESFAFAKTEFFITVITKNGLSESHFGNRRFFKGFNTKYNWVKSACYLSIHV